MLITIEKTETRNQAVEVTLPAYYKWNHVYIKIVSLSETIEVRDTDSFFSIGKENYSSLFISTAVSEGAPISEQEFLVAFERVGEKVKRELIKAIETDGWKAQEQAELQANALAEVETTQS